VSDLGWIPSNSFRLAADGTCYSPFDVWANIIGLKILQTLVAIIVIGALAQFLLVRCGLRARLKQVARRLGAEEISEDAKLLRASSETLRGGGPLSREEQSSRSHESILHGVRSWYLGHMRDWELREHPVPQRYSLCRALVRSYIIGPGLPLFYGFQGLVFVSSVTTAVVLWVVQWYSGLQPALTKLNKAGREAARRGNHWEMNKLIEFEDKELLDYAWGMFVGMGLLYLILFAFSLMYAYGSHEFSRHFNQFSSCMEDFTVSVFRLPVDETNETQVRHMVEKQLNCPGEILGVSIAYNVADATVQGTINRLIENRIARAEVEYCERGTALAKEFGFGYPANLARDEVFNELDDQKEFEELYRSGKLRGSGKAFIVFKRKSACSAIKAQFQGFWVRSTMHLAPEDVKAIQNVLGGICVGKFLDTCEEKKDSVGGQCGGKSLDDLVDMSKDREFARVMSDITVGGETLGAGTRIYDPKSVGTGCPIVVERLVEVAADNLEPTGALWFHFGKPKYERQKRTLAAVARVLKTWAIIIIVVIMPIYYYVTYPFGLARTSTHPYTSQLQGIALGISGNLLGGTIWSAVSDIGYYNKNNQDANFVMSSTATSFVNTALFGCAGLIVFVQMGFNRVDMSNTRTNSLDDFTREVNLFRSFYNMMIPGWLFSGVLTGKLMGIILPILQNFLITNIVFTLRLLPPTLRKLVCHIIPGNPQEDWLSARAAETVFRGPSLALAWEFSNFIVTPSICCFVLFIMSPKSWLVFAYLAGWAALMFVLHRFVTVPISKKEISGVPVTALADRLWGLPVAIVAAAFGFWGVRCGAFGSTEMETSYWVVLWLFLLGLIVHTWALDKVARHAKKQCDHHDVPYTEVRDKLRYTWFNTNPVHVLKSCHLPEELGEDAATIAATVPFEYGKEYLQLPDSAQQESTTPGTTPWPWASLGFKVF